MPKYTVEITDIENKAMTYIAVEVQNWIDTAVTERARRAKASALLFGLQGKQSLKRPAISYG